MENTMHQINMLRNALTLLDACDPATDAIYQLSTVFYGSYHEEYENLNDAFYTIKQSLTNKLSALELALTPIT